MTDRETPSPDERNTARIIRPLTDFLHREASGGILLVAAAIVALVWANSPWSASYTNLWHTDAFIGIGRHVLDLSLRDWVNDLLMVLFFFVVGLEIKRELTQGELRDPRQAALPIIGAIGGMIVPAGIYALLNAGTDGSQGWGIPMATDIAIVSGLLAILGPRVPAWLKLFLLALAIVDDIGAIIVIAVFYSSGVSFTWLAVAVASVAVAFVIRGTTQSVGPFLVLGAICWFSLHEAHIHPTLAGVAFGLLAPVTPRRDTELVDADELTLPSDAAEASRLAANVRGSVSTVEWLEFRLHPWSAFVVLPIFALANAGVHIPAGGFERLLTGRVALGVIGGLVIGKMVGIAAFTLAAVALKVGSLPAGVTSRHIIGGGALGGIGFTVSLFINELAFEGTELGADAGLAILVGSLMAAILGTVICIVRPSPDANGGATTTGHRPSA